MTGNNLYLIGYRATGKTTVARLLAERFNCQTVDADDMIETRAEMPIKEIFAAHGEAGFRDLETEVVKEISTRVDTVVALGGGALQRPENRRQLSGTGTMVWLKAAAETIQRRIEGDPTTGARRPDLTAAGGLEEIQQLLLAREPVYQECADYQVDTEDKSAASVTAEIHSWYVEHRAEDR